MDTKMSSLILLPILAQFGGCFPDTSVDLSKKLREDKIVPDVLPFEPVNILRVHWENASATIGNTLLIPDVRFEPTVSWPYEEESFYTLICVGPDEPDPQNATMREYQHWLVVNIPATNVTAGKVLTEYIKPATPIAYGPQRYVFVVYYQPKGNQTPFDEPFLPGVPNDEVRAGFSTQKFASKYGFGTPLAVNWYWVAWGSLKTHFP